MADTIYYIRTDAPDDLGTGLKDTIDPQDPDRAFRTCRGAEAAIQGTLGAGDRWICEVHAGEYDWFYVDGSTINGTWVWRSLDGDQHLGVPNAGVVIATTNTGVEVTYVLDNNVHFEDMQFRHDGVGSARRCFFLGSNTFNVTTRRCIFGFNNTGNGQTVLLQGRDYLIESCLIFDTRGGNPALVANQKGDVHCCTVPNNNATGLQSSGGAAELTVHNTVSWGNALDFQRLSGTFDGSFNASGDASAIGTDVLTNIPDPFTNEAANDYSISGPGSALYDAGTALFRPGVDSRGQSNFAINYIPFTQNDIGAFAFDGGVVPGEDVEVDLPAATINVAGANPTVETLTGSEDIFIELGGAALQVTGFAPTVGIANDVFAELDKAAIDITPANPLVDIGDDLLIELPNAAVNVQGVAPTVTAGADLDIDIPGATVAVDPGEGPQVLVEENIFVNLPAPLVDIQGKFPTVTLVGNVEVNLPSAAVRVDGVPPRVLVGEDADTKPSEGIGAKVLSEVVVDPTNEVIP